MKKKPQADSYEILTVPFQGLSETGDDLLDLGDLQENQFRGMASVFGRVVDAHIPTIMQRGAFTKTLQERRRAIPILWQHNPNQPIGKPVHLFESDEGLVLQAQISRTSLGKDALILMRDEVIRALSIGFQPVVFDFDEIEGVETRFIREARLTEISVVTLGADANALISEVRSGFVSGSLERYRAGHGVIFGDVADDVVEDEPEVADQGTESLGQKLQAFSIEYLSANPDASEADLAEAFAATLHKAEPDVEPLTLSDVEHRLQMAELLAAEMKLETL